MKPYIVLVVFFVLGIGVGWFFNKKSDKPTPPIDMPIMIPISLVVAEIDSLDSKRDTIKIYYEKKINNYSILPPIDRVRLFSERINR
jgi:hypothetical protein